MREHFKEPTFLNPELEILDKEVSGTSTVKAALLQELPAAAQQGEEVKTKHFYIKQVLLPGEDLPLNLPEYNWDKPATHCISNVKSILKILRANGSPETATEVLKEAQKTSHYMENLNFRLAIGETVSSRIEKCMDLLRPETVLRHTKQLYDRHCQWYDKKIPDFVIPKLFVLGKDQEGNTRGYVLKEHTKALEDEPPFFSFADVFNFARADHVEEAGISAVHQLRNHFEHAQRAILKKEIKAFVSISRRVMRTEGLAIDLSGNRFDSSNIRITQDGHLRMIDTDRVYPARRIDGRLDMPAINNERCFKALDYIVEHLED